MRLWVFVIGFLFILAEGCVHEPMAPFKLRGIWHKVSSGDTVFSVSERYGASIESVAEINDLPGSGSLRGREEVFVPKQDGKPPGTGVPPSRGSYALKCGANGRPCMAWPVDGETSSKFGPRSNGHHDGIDISAKRGEPVRAAADGTVLYSGDEIKGYGNLIIVRHEDAVITVYAHNDKNLVKEGDIVTSRQVIARVGNSGGSTGMHLHFEVRVKEQPQNPLLFLSQR